MNIRYDLSELSIFSGKNYIEFKEKTNKESSVMMSSYRKDLQNSLEKLWNEEITLSAFYLLMYALVEESYSLAWYYGMSLAGISEFDMIDDERLALIQTIREEQGHIEKLGNDIIKAMSEGKDISIFKGRLNMWANSLLEAQNKALMYAHSNPKLMWVEGDTIKKCKDCLSQNGKVRRAKEWMKLNIHPQSSNLECKGINCECSFVPVSGL